MIAQSVLRRVKESELPAKFQYPAIYAYPFGSPEQKKLSAEFEQYLAENKIYYYARPREQFFYFEADQLAREAGCTALLLEDMS